MMTMLVATLGLLPAALSHDIGSDSQRPFAIVIAGGLISDLVISIFLLPALYVWMAGDRDALPPVETEAVWRLARGVCASVKIQSHSRKVSFVASVEFP